MKNIEIQIVLAPEVIIDRGDITLGLGYNLPDGGAIKAVFGKELFGRVNEAFSRFLP